MGVTTDRNSPCLNEFREDGQQECHIVLSDEEIAKGYVQPVRENYIHLKCGVDTRMPNGCALTYARSPQFYGGTFCCGCSAYFNLKDADGKYAFRWSRQMKGAPEYVGQPVEVQ
jgi:hypothetical protein